MKTHHVLISSEQAWPNMLGMAYLLNRDSGLASLHIVHSDDKRRSYQPALRLQSVSKLLFPELKPELHTTNAMPGDVYSTVAHLIDASPPDEKWTINATGGTKLMFAGLVPFVNRPSIELYYRDINCWYRLETNPSGSLFTNPFPEADSVKVDLPVCNLIRAQVEAPQGAQWKAIQSVPDLDLESIVSRGIETQWNWHALKKEFPNLTQKNHGFVFEDIFAAIVKEAGATNFARNVELIIDGIVKQELDLVVSTGTEILVFDLKLSSEPVGGVTDQIKRVSDDAKRLGGIVARAIAVRPNWTDEGGTTKALAKAHRVEVWTQEDMGNIISLIVKSLKLPEPNGDSVIVSCRKLLQEVSRQGKRIFDSYSPSRKTKETHPADPIPTESRIGWLHSDGYRVECKRSGYSSCVLELCGRFLVWCEGELPDEIVKHAEVVSDDILTGKIYSIFPNRCKGDLVKEQLQKLFADE